MMCMTSIYKQPDYGKYTLEDMLNVYKELEDGGDSKIYLRDLAIQLENAIHIKNDVAQFGPESAMEVVLMLFAFLTRERNDINFIKDISTVGTNES